jgi:hypothetical protein
MKQFRRSGAAYERVKRKKSDFSMTEKQTPSSHYSTIPVNTQMAKLTNSTEDAFAAKSSSSDPVYAIVGKTLAETDGAPGLANAGKSKVDFQGAAVSSKASVVSLVRDVIR